MDLALASRCMYLLTIRDGLQTRHIGPFASPQQAADHLDGLLPLCGEKAHWQIHELEAPEAALRLPLHPQGHSPLAA